MTNYDQILADLKKELLQSLEHLEYSFDKIKKKNWSIDMNKDPDALETFEALVSRFARTTDIYVARYLRSIAEKDDPAFRGSLRDWVNYAEKKGVIHSAKEWMAIRELRNKISHEYAAKDLDILFNQVLSATPDVLAIKKTIK